MATATIKSIFASSFPYLCIKQYSKEHDRRAELPIFLKTFITGITLYPTSVG